MFKAILITIFYMGSVYFCLLFSFWKCTGSFLCFWFFPIYTPFLYNHVLWLQYIILVNISFISNNFFPLQSFLFLPSYFFLFVLVPFSFNLIFSVSVSFSHSLTINPFLRCLVILVVCSYRERLKSGLENTMAWRLWCIKSLLSGAGSGLMSCATSNINLYA